MDNPQIADENTGREDLLPDHLDRLLAAHQGFLAKEGRSPTWQELATMVQDIHPDIVKRYIQDMDTIAGELKPITAIALFWRLKRLLDVQFSGDLFFKSDQMYYQYASLRRAFLELSGEAPALETLRREFLDSGIPESLYDVNHEFPDEDWEYGIEPALRALTGKIMAFCIEASINPFEETEVDRALAGYDRFIEAYEKDKKRKQQDFWKGVNAVAESAPWAKASGITSAKGQKQQPETNAAKPATASAQVNPNGREATGGEGGHKERIQVQPKCVAWKTRLIKAMKDLPPGTESTQENMAGLLGLSFDRVRELSSQHNKCCGFNWIRDVRHRGLLQA